MSHSKNLFLGAAILFAVALFAVFSWGSEDSSQGQADSAKKESAPAKQAEKATQTAPAPQTQTQTQTADDDIPRLIEETPTSKNTVTIPTPVGVQEGSQRRNDTYNKLSKPAKDAALDARRSAEKTETAGSETEQAATDKESTDDKPPLR